MRGGEGRGGEGRGGEARGREGRGGEGGGEWRGGGGEGERRYGHSIARDWYAVTYSADIFISVIPDLCHIDCL